MAGPAGGGAAAGGQDHPGGRGGGVVTADDGHGPATCPRTPQRPEERRRGVVAGVLDPSGLAFKQGVNGAPSAAVGNRAVPPGVSGESSVD